MESSTKEKEKLSGMAKTKNIPSDEWREDYAHWLQEVVEYHADNAIYSRFDAEEAQKSGDREGLAKAVAQNDRWCWYVDRLDAERDRNGDPESVLRSDFESLKFVSEVITRDFEERREEAGMPHPLKLEDYGPDIYETGITESEEFYAIPYEVKTLCGKFGNEEFQRTCAGRNVKCRYCESAATVEEIMAAGEKPEWLKNKKPIALINDTDYYGNVEGAKKSKMLAGKWGLIFLMEGNILIYSPSAFKKAILGYVWIICKHTKRFKNKKEQLERKAAIDLSAYSRKINCEVPKELLGE